MRATYALRITYSAAIIAGVGSLLVSACGGSNKSAFSGGGEDAGNQGPYNGDGSVNFLEASAFSEDALAAADPPNLWCGPEAGAPPPVTIGGSPDCPTDKNLPGCPCGPPGTTAACWPGLRANRDVGDCKDGTTTCQMNGENQGTWGPCNGAVLPDPSGTTAAAQCSCFSEGQWHIDNLVPQFITYSSNNTTYGVSTVQSPDSGTTEFESLDDGGISEPPPVPTEQWTTDELTVDCNGTYTLCYQLKYGDYNNPLPSDCAVTPLICAGATAANPSVGVPTYYSGADRTDGGAAQSQLFPPLPPWETTAAASACSLNFFNKGGYGEMSVLGKSDVCQEIDNGSGGSFVFHRIQYCPNTTPNCGQDGSGTFK